MSYYDNQESVANIYVGLRDRGWKCYGYKADESDSMTDYWSPARWQGIAEKDGYVLLVDVYGTSDSGRKITKQAYTPDYSKISKLQATIDDKAASQNEKEQAQKIIDKMYSKQKESTVIIEEYPTFSQGNPKGCNWHIEKDGKIIAKGKGAFQCDGYLFGNYEKETMKKVNAFIDKIESKIKGSEQLQPVQQKVIKKVIKPVEVTDRKVLKIGDVLSFDYHGHYWQVYSLNDKTYSYELLGSEKRGYQKKKNPKRYYDYLTKFDKNLESGRIKIYELKEVEEVSYKTVYKKVTRKGQENNLIENETIAPETIKEETMEQTQPETVEHSSKQKEEPKNTNNSKENESPLTEIKNTIQSIIEYYHENNTYNSDLLKRLMSLSMDAPFNIYELINKYNYIVLKVADNGGIPILKEILSLIENESITDQQKAPEQPTNDNKKVIDFSSKQKEKQQEKQSNNFKENFIINVLPYLNKDESRLLQETISTKDESKIYMYMSDLENIVNSRQKQPKSK